VRAGVDSFAQHGFGFWGVREKGRDELVGFVGIRLVESGEDVEILYGIVSPLWGRGYATEAALAVLGWAFRETALPRIFAGADAGNRASSRVLEKLGMRYDGTRRTVAGETPYWVVRREDYDIQS
jgi:RimJ/RimL family protein N-acetyltransferase